MPGGGSNDTPLRTGPDGTPLRHFDQPSHERDAKPNIFVKLPPFNRKNASLWFTQVEANFAIHNFASEALRYNYLLSTLEADVAEQVQDVLLVTTAETEQPYSGLKSRLINVYADS